MRYPCVDHCFVLSCLVVGLTGSKLRLDQGFGIRVALGPGRVGGPRAGSRAHRSSMGSTCTVVLFYFVSSFMFYLWCWVSGFEIWDSCLILGVWGYGVHFFGLESRARGLVLKVAHVEVRWVVPTLCVWMGFRIILISFGWSLEPGDWNLGIEAADTTTCKVTLIILYGVVCPGGFRISGLVLEVVHVEV